MPMIDFNLKSYLGDHKITNTHIALRRRSQFKVPRKVAAFIWVRQEAVSDHPTTCEVSTQRPVGGSNLKDKCDKPDNVEHDLSEDLTSSSIKASREKRNIVEEEEEEPNNQNRAFLRNQKFQSNHYNSAAKVRRLYDIANVLSSMNLIQKTHHTENRKPAFRWLGFSGCSYEKTFMVTEPLESKKRAFGADITNVDCKRNKMTNLTEVSGYGVLGKRSRCLSLIQATSEGHEQGVVDDRDTLMHDVRDLLSIYSSNPTTSYYITAISVELGSHCLSLIQAASEGHEQGAVDDRDRLMHNVRDLLSIYSSNPMTSYYITAIPVELGV
ncbi:hypothetical protein GIB67_029004 [Kingdonia uniflora]|uniref:E2F/DP family winged-helix DNA-binding domain-containing protein n=1 Tax=Kingdonia uniflora TaxID=39325 RepID=A0A7J7N6G2_9MAGN|nr:hypothetical protein GIB67_029004 [Kingdonia uniflora]